MSDKIPLAVEWLNAVYDILVKKGDASASMRQSFIQVHLEEGGCSEWRFIGHLGFGGKYLSKTNEVCCYREDETKERKEIIRVINEALENLKNQKA